MNQYLTYLASPYSVVRGFGNIPCGFALHSDNEIKHQRFLSATQAAANLMNIYSFNVFSPIVHSHPLHIHAKMRGDWEFWKKIDTEYLKMSRRIVVLCDDGWEVSVGVQAELKIARRLKIPVYYTKDGSVVYKMIPQ